jgi:hypothetical protein
LRAQGFEFRAVEGAEFMRVDESRRLLV